MIKRSGDWLSARVGDQIMMMSAERGNYLGVNEVGARIWELVETPTDLDSICRQLLQEFEITPEKCSDEVNTFLTDMANHGAVAINPA